MGFIIFFCYSALYRAQVTTNSFTIAITHMFKMNKANRKDWLLKVPAAL